MKTYGPSSRNKVKRVPKRGHYDQKTVYEVLDAGFVCHVGFVVNGQPFVIPTAYGREDDTIYIHGATKSRMMMAAGEGVPICITVTHLDGIVLARSAFHHSMNYRSVVVFGEAHEVEPDQKNHALYVISEQILKDRWEESRQPSEKELKATTVLAVKINEASAKIRTGPPSDDKADYELPIWAGVIPMETVYREPLTDPDLTVGIPIAPSVLQLDKI